MLGLASCDRELRQIEILQSLLIIRREFPENPIILTIKKLWQGSVSSQDDTSIRLQLLRDHRPHLMVQDLLAVLHPLGEIKI